MARGHPSAPIDMTVENDFTEHTERLDYGTVLITGGGPVGLMVATVLARYGVKSVVLERNESTTKWPKMDLTNARSMELLARLGLADQVRAIGVSENVPYSVFMTSGLHNERPITSWGHPSVTQLRAEYKGGNDGSSPAEPWLRVSQAIFERFLKEICDKNPLIDCRFGWKVEKTTESEDGVQVQAADVRSNLRSTLFARYSVACDGASSITRRDTCIPLDGGPVPGYALLVHFKSRDWQRLLKFGNFWHLFIFDKDGLRGAAINQDDNDTFTTHLLLPMDVDHEAIDSHDAVYRALGGMGEPFKIKIDEILVRSTYRHSIAVARSLRSPLGKVFLAGDSAHQNIPTGGYGMNTGIGDAFDIGWKLAAVMTGKAGPFLLDSYDEERRPIATESIQRSGIHMRTHGQVSEFIKSDPLSLDRDCEDGRILREKIHQHYQANSGENTDLGIEMDHRHKSSAYPLPAEPDGEAPPWEPARYTPSTHVGSRAPHVFLTDGKSIFDLYGPYWTLVDFSSQEGQTKCPKSFIEAAETIKMPLKHVVLQGEENARKVWQVPLVLVRPDGHVAWRGTIAPSLGDALALLKKISGWEKSPWTISRTEVPREAFASTEGAGSQIEDYHLEKMGVMQK